MLIAVLVSSLVTLAAIAYVVVRQLALQQSTTERFEASERAHDRVERGLREELGRGRDESRLVMKDLATQMQTRVAEAAQHQREHIDGFARTLQMVTETLDARAMVSLSKTIDDRLLSLQADNGQKLEQMRATVDEKLQGTLERRLGESFKLVSDRLELVHKGLGEMQTLAAGVGDLRKVLTNVKTRGT